MKRLDPDAMLAAQWSAGWFGDFRARRHPTPPTVPATIGHIPRHAWRFAQKIEAELREPRDHGLHIGSRVLKRTVQALSRIAAGDDPILVALAAMKDHPGGAGSQIAEDALSAWLRKENRAAALQGIPA